MERFNRYLKNGIQAFNAAGTPWKEGLRELIASYRAMPLHGCKSPAQFFLGHRMHRGHEPNRSKPTRRTVQEQSSEPKARTKIYYSKVYKKGEKVLTKKPHAAIGSSPYSEPKTVERVLGRYTFLLSDGRVWNARKLKPYRSEGTQPLRPFYMDPSEEQQRRKAQPVPVPRSPLRCSTRITFGKPPARFRDE
ncbi:MAG: hypothetical protein GY696_08385 [Gammaproteobacteria bacterium]|nr:hypothetical protein [Gammaproteobacteria bacterium]